MNTLSRLALLARFVGIGITEFKGECYKTLRASPRREYCQRSQIGLLFQLKRSDGRTASAGAKMFCNPRDANLVQDTVLRLSGALAPESQNSLRLDAHISEFLRAVSASYDEVKAALPEDTLEVFEYLEEFSNPKARIFPASAILRNDQLFEHFPNLFGRFALHRAKANSFDATIVCREQISIQDQSNPVMVYKDSWEREFRGYATFSDDKVVANLVGEGLSSGKIQNAIATIYKTDIGTAEHLCVLQRFDSGNAKSHTYRCIAKRVDNDVAVSAKLSVSDPLAYRYYKAVSNQSSSASPSNAHSVGGTSSFEASVEAARVSLHDGQALEKAYLGAATRYRNYYSIDDVVRQILKNK